MLSVDVRIITEASMPAMQGNFELHRAPVVTRISPENVPADYQRLFANLRHNLEDLFSFGLAGSIRITVSAKEEFCCIVGTLRTMVESEVELVRIYLGNIYDSARKLVEMLEYGQWFELAAERSVEVPS